tara:strand:+ start:214 stop:765 length:552 start_codon:yes stop_codon:yes gene_type:complete
MEFKTTNINGLILIKPKKFKDNRGFFLESFQKSNYEKIVGKHVFVQDNFSKSKKNVIRGLHYQLKNSQDKLIYVTQGALMNVVVDLRKSSPTFLCKFKIKLSDNNNLQLFIPKGCANGILSLSEELSLNYKCTDYYNPSSALGIRWNDPTININWGIEKPILSSQDKKLPFYKDLLINNLLPR